MQIQLGELNKADFHKAVQFAITGMHFDWYLSSKTLLDLYGRYFLYHALEQATQVIAAYEGNTLAGLLLCEINGESKKFHSPHRAAYVQAFDFLQKTFVKEGAGVYDATNKSMYESYSRNHSPDGEIIFLAANPNVKIKGIGSMLLAELERREKGKEVYLYTDDACTYQFYERRGFTLAEERNVELKFGKKTVPLRCLLYCKVLG